MSWPSRAYIEGLTDLINLKSKVGSATLVDVLSYPDPTNYQKRSLVKNMQAAIQALLADIWIVDQNYDGATDFTVIDWAYVMTNVLGGHDWEAMYHREVVDNTSTVEIYRGQAVANGQRAYRRSDKQIVDRVAGAWVPNTTASHADYITDYGQMIGGDFFRDKLFTQMEDVLAILTTVGRTATTTGSTANVKDGLASDPVLATAESAAEADYGAATATNGSSIKAYNSLTQNSGPGDFNAFLHRSFDFPTIGFLSGLKAKAVTFYGTAIANVGVSNATFDAFGDPVLEGLLKSCSTGSGVAAATSVTGAQVGSLAQPSPTWATTPTPTDSYSRGYQITSIKAAVKYTF